MFISKRSRNPWVNDEGLSVPELEEEEVGVGVGIGELLSSGSVVGGDSM